MTSEHWRPVVDIATDTGPEVSRFAAWPEWAEANEWIQSSIEAVID